MVGDKVFNEAFISKIGKRFFARLGHIDLHGQDGIEFEEVCTIKSNHSKSVVSSDTYVTIYRAIREVKIDVDGNIIDK